MNRSLGHKPRISPGGLVALEYFSCSTCAVIKQRKQGALKRKVIQIRGAYSFSDCKDFGSCSVHGAPGTVVYSSLTLS